MASSGIAAFARRQGLLKSGSKAGAGHEEQQSSCALTDSGKPGAVGSTGTAEEEGRVVGYPHCRICWGASDSERGGQLVSPCQCTGSVRYIHLRCLHKWQRTLRSQGSTRKAHTCDLCCARYRLTHSAPLWLTTSNSNTARLLKTAAWVTFEGWQFAVLVGGVVQGGRCGWAGLLSGGSCSSRHVGSMWTTVSRWAPEVMVAAVLAPRLQRAIIHGALLLGAASFAEVAVVTGVCGTVAALAGAVSGSSCVVTWSCVQAVKCTRWGLFRIRRGLGGVLGIMRSVLREGLPVATIIVGAVTLH